ncbi:hypothetical protein EXT48_08155 [Pseudoalteromonas sp. CO348]|uniref:hypothetical protein n=1 Tax=Pseudoalteromonas sp. CO348 TaxID=1777271 RepID=UPI0010234E16|nr:hypothetical protein [Pseudoalteromonas sp. CO348]RZG05498.1 hypothetical protein EXT48_08155 [Pseudoalteromonas sp. CO348]
MDRAALNRQIKTLHKLSHYSYQTSRTMTSAAGAAELAEAVQDETRIDSPNSWDGLLLYSSGQTAKALKSKLENFNQSCPIADFIHTAAYAESLTTVEQDKFTITNGQSLEWQTLTTTSLKPLSLQWLNDSKRLINDEGTTLITSIDNAMTETEKLKAERNYRLNPSEAHIVTRLNAELIKASSRGSLAQAITRYGNNDEHWVFVLLVGNFESLSIVKDAI